MNNEWLSKTQRRRRQPRRTLPGRSSSTHVLLLILLFVFVSNSCSNRAKPARENKRSAVASAGERKKTAPRRNLDLCPVVKTLRPCKKDSDCPDGSWCEYGACFNRYVITQLMLESQRGHDCKIDIGFTEEEPLRSAKACRGSEACRVYGSCGFVDGKCAPTKRAHCKNAVRCRRMNECVLHEGVCQSLKWECGARGLCKEGPNGLEAVSDADCERSYLCKHNNVPCSMLRGRCETTTRSCPQKDRVQRLACLLEDKTWSVRDAAAHELGRMGGKAKSAVAALKRALQQDKNDSVRHAAYTALRAIQGDTR